MLFLRFLSFICVIGLSQVSAVILKWDDFEHGTGLHVTHKGAILRNGLTWSVHETQKEDTEIFNKILTNPEVRKYMAAGKPLEDSHISQLFQRSLNRFKEGIPSGLLVLEQEEQSLGLIHLVPHTTPGVGEIIRALLPEAQGQGIGKAALGFLVNDWAPALRKRGLGLDINPSHPTVEKFKCFEGQPLDTIYTSARPSNVASWQGYKYYDFQPCPIQKNTQIDCRSWDESWCGPLEEYIIDKYFSEVANNKLQADVLYPMIDEEGHLRTLSLVSKYGSLRYHFERKVDLH